MNLIPFGAFLILLTWSSVHCNNLAKENQQSLSQAPQSTQFPQTQNPSEPQQGYQPNGN